MADENREQKIRDITAAIAKAEDEKAKAIEANNEVWRQQIQEQINIDKKRLQQWESAAAAPAAPQAGKEDFYLYLI